MGACSATTSCTTLHLPLLDDWSRSNRLCPCFSCPFLDILSSINTIHDAELPPKIISSTLSEDPAKPFHCEGRDPSHLIPEVLLAHNLTDYSPETAATVSGPQVHPSLDTLFHLPPLPVSILSPRTFPSVDKAFTEALVKTLSDNHVHWHIFFNYKGFHKYVMDKNIQVSVFDLSHSHVSHHMLVIWALGAPGPIIEAAYATHCKYQCHWRGKRQRG